jgi:hypothetical protein
MFYSLIFSNPDHHLKPCPIDTHKKGYKAFKMGNLREFSLGGVISVTNGKLHGKKWNSLFIKICNGETDHA